MNILLFKNTRRRRRRQQLWRDKAARHAGMEGKNKQHFKLCAPAVQPATPSPCPTCPTGQEDGCRRDVTGSTGRQCKLPKYLTNWKDPEDVFALTTNISLVKRAGQLSP